MEMLAACSPLKMLTHQLKLELQVEKYVEAVSKSGHSSFFSFFFLRGSWGWGNDFVLLFKSILQTSRYSECYALLCMVYNTVYC